MRLKYWWFLLFYNIFLMQLGNSQLGFKINTKQGSKEVKFTSQSIPIPYLPAAIQQFQAILTKVGVEETEENDQPTKKVRYVGQITGNFVVPSKKFSKPFSFKVPFSFKHNNGIALSFSTNDFSREKLSLLNQFVFGDQNIKPVIISEEIAVELVTLLLEKAQGFEKLKNYYQKALNFIKQNSISMNLLIDYVNKQYQVGFFWQEFKIDGMPSEIKISNVMFGLSVNSNPAVTQNKFAVKIGGKGQFTINNKTQNDIYIEYSYDSKEQKLQLRATFSVLTSLLQLLGVDTPEQIRDFTQHTILSVEWISDPKKKIVDEIKNSK